MKFEAFAGIWRFNLLCNSLVGLTTQTPTPGPKRKPWSRGMPSNHKRTFAMLFGMLAFTMQGPKSQAFLGALLPQNMCFGTPRFRTQTQTERKHKLCKLGGVFPSSPTLLETEGLCYIWHSIAYPLLPLPLPQSAAAVTRATTTKHHQKKNFWARFRSYLCWGFGPIPRNRLKSRFCPVRS